MSNQVSTKQILVAGAIAGVVSAVINAILFFVFHSAGIISDAIFVQPNQALTIVPVIVSSIIPSILGACVFLLLKKFTQNSFKLFSILAVVLTVLSFASPFMAVPNMPILYGSVLDVMHIVVVGSLLFFLKKHQ